MSTLSTPTIAPVAILDLITRYLTTLDEAGLCPAVTARIRVGAMLADLLTLAGVDRADWPMGVLALVDQDRPYTPAA